MKIQNQLNHLKLIKCTQDEVDSPTVKHVAEIELSTVNGEQNNGKEDEFLSTNYEVKMENRNIKGLITYSSEQKMSNSRVVLEVTKNYL